MTEGIVTGFQVKGRIVCDGCSGVFPRGHRVTHGPVTGIFHSGTCFNEQLAKYEQKKAAEDAVKEK